MEEKRKNVPQVINDPESISLVTVILVIAIIGLLLSILIRSFSATEAIVETEAAQSQFVPGGSEPIISDVVLRESWQSDELIVYQDIYFTDADGDVAQADYTLIETTAEEVYVEDGIVRERPEAQREGTIHTGIWTCHSGTHTVTLQIELVDQNKHRSEPYPFTITCRN